MILNPKTRLNHFNDVLTETMTSLKELVKKSEDAESDTVSLKELKEILKPSTESIRILQENIKTLNTSDKIGGVFRLKVLTSKGREIYFLEGFEGNFYVEADLKVDPENPECTIKMFNMYAPNVNNISKDSDVPSMACSFGHLTLTEALVEGLVACINDNEELSKELDAMEGCILIPRVRHKLEKLTQEENAAQKSTK